MVHSFIPFLKEQIPEIEGVPLIIMDSASGHIQSDSKASLQRFSILSTIAGGGTQHVQAIDTDYSQKLRFLYREQCYYPWTALEKKVTAMELANLMLTWLADSHRNTCEFMDPVKVFLKLGYITPSEETIRIRSVDGYHFRPMAGAALPDLHLGPPPEATPPPRKKTIFDSWIPGPNPIPPAPPRPPPPPSHAPKGMLKWVTKKTVVPEREEEMFAEPVVLPESDDDRPLPPQVVPPPPPVPAPPQPYHLLHEDFEIPQATSMMEMMKNARRRDVATT